MPARILGNYELADKLGEGGMGEVWRARDRRLDRAVAIKLLPADFSIDVTRRARFEQEARALGALNHPNLLSIYDVGEEDGCAYIVSELVEGESLRTMLDRGPVAPRRAIEIAVQMAEGIAAAHALGVVHRDLKPANVMLNRAGQVKILDFGLAKQSLPLASDKTATLALSQPGMIMGTVGYMSPEQVRGDAVDARSDIFSFGCVLYELLAGRRAFQAASSVETMHAVLNSDPAELDSEHAQIPPALATIVRRCLEKRPEQRFQSAADLAFALRSITNPSMTAIRPTPAPARRSRWMRTAAFALGGCLLLGGAYFLAMQRNRHDAPRFQRITYRKGDVISARFTADGRNVIYTARWEGGPARMYLGVPGNPEARDLGVPDDNKLLSVSSNGDLLYVNRSGVLQQSSISGGQTRPLLEGVIAADWAPDGASIAVMRIAGGATGRTARIEYPIGKVLADNMTFPLESIRVSPDGEQVAYVTFSQGRKIELFVVNRAGVKRSLGIVSGETSVNEASPMAWTPNGSEIWFRSYDAGDPLTTYGVDLKSRKRLVMNLPGHATLYDISRSGRSLLTTGSMQMGIMGLTKDYKEERDLSCLDLGMLAGISDDGTLIAASVFGDSGGPKGSIYLRKTDGSPAFRLGDGVAYTLAADGKWVAGYGLDDTGRRHFAAFPTGAGEPVLSDVPGMASIPITGFLGPDTYLVAGPGPSKQWQCFGWNTRSKTVRPICPPGIPDWLGVTFVSPDGKQVLNPGPNGGWFAYPVNGGDAKQIEGMLGGETAVGWRSDNRSVYVRKGQTLGGSTEVWILDGQTGKRTLWKQLRFNRPIDEPGDLHLHITPDGSAYAYNYSIRMSDLYAADGLN